MSCTSSWAHIPRRSSHIVMVSSFSSSRYLSNFRFLSNSRPRSLLGDVNILFNSSFLR